MKLQNNVGVEGRLRCCIDHAVRRRNGEKALQCCILQRCTRIVCPIRPGYSGFNFKDIQLHYYKSGCPHSVHVRGLRQKEQYEKLASDAREAYKPLCFKGLSSDRV